MTVFPSVPLHDGPDADGFTGVTFTDGYSASFGRMLARGEGADTARVRVGTGPDHANVIGGLHGGFMLAMLDQALFVGPGALGRLPVGGAVTLTTATQFMTAGRCGVPLDCVVEIARETRRLLFLRGQMEQGGAVLLTWQATLSKRDVAG